jgi:hypothetical protein
MLDASVAALCNQQWTLPAGVLQHDPYMPSLKKAFEARLPFQETPPMGAAGF